MKWARDLTIAARWTRDLALIVAITVAVLFPIAVYARLDSRVNSTAKTAAADTKAAKAEAEAQAAKDASFASCNNANKVRTEFLSFVDSTVERSEAATAALLRSPTTTAQQRRVAVSNLAALRAADVDAHRHAPLEKCIAPT